MSDQTTVLVAMSDEQQLTYLCDQLSADAYRPVAAASAQEACVKARVHPPAVLVLGELAERHEELRSLRAIRTTGPEASGIDPWLGVIVVGIDRGELAQLRVFEAGCDDYVAHDVPYPLLRARLGALLARLRRVRRAPRRVGLLTVDPHSRTASHAGKPLGLTRMEFALLDQLASDPEPCGASAARAARGPLMPMQRKTLALTSQLRTTTSSAVQPPGQRKRSAAQMAVNPIPSRGLLQWPAAIKTYPLRSPTASSNSSTWPAARGAGPSPQAVNAAAVSSRSRGASRSASPPVSSASCSNTSMAAASALRSSHRSIEPTSAGSSVASSSAGGDRSRGRRRFAGLGDGTRARAPGRAPR